VRLDDAEDRSAAAGEYVLGTLTAAERAAFEAALAGDAALRAAVYAWQDRLLPLRRQAEPAEPAAGLWARIEARLPRAPQAEAANDPLWQRLRRWQLGSALATAAALLLATLLVLRVPTPPADGPRFLAVLQHPDTQAAGWIVEASARGVRLVPVGASAAVPPGKALQFWTKAEGAAGPTSLGLVPAGQVTELPFAKLPTLEAQQLFELTLEPETGSPIGRPTGPILYVGRTVPL
jgi:anti-sigma-K factor RskA